MQDIYRTVFAKYPESDVLFQYKKVAMDMLHLNFPLLTTAELSAAIDYSMSEHFKDVDVTIDNNYKKVQINQTLLQVADYIMRRQPIMTTFGVLFSRHGSMPNPVYNMIDSFISGRKKMKKEMFKYPKGSEMFERYNLLQLLLNFRAV